jgi:hypothetical protein
MRACVSWRQLWQILIGSTIWSLLVLLSTMRVRLRESKKAAKSAR